MANNNNAFIELTDANDRPVLVSVASMESVMAAQSHYEWQQLEGKVEHAAYDRVRSILVRSEPDNYTPVVESVPEIADLIRGSN